MSDTPVGNLRYKALADPTRRRLLRVMDDVGEPIGIEELAARLGLHVNTIRGHLDLLEQAHLVERNTERRGTPGRPRILFTAAPRDARSPTGEGYRFLAEILSNWMADASVTPAIDAERAGERWGRQLAREGDTPVSVDRAVEQVMTTFAELGFQPERAESAQASRTVLRLHDCPFRDLARGPSDIVCSVHAGLLRGMLAELGGAVRLDELQPFLEPSLCVASLEAQ